MQKQPSMYSSETGCACNHVGDKVGQAQEAKVPETFWIRARPLGGLYIQPPILGNFRMDSFGKPVALQRCRVTRPEAEAPRRELGADPGV